MKDLRIFSQKRITFFAPSNFFCAYTRLSSALLSDHHENQIFSLWTILFLQESERKTPLGLNSRQTVCAVFDKRAIPRFSLSDPIKTRQDLWLQKLKSSPNNHSCSFQKLLNVLFQKTTKNVCSVQLQIKHPVWAACQTSV